MTGRDAAAELTDAARTATEALLRALEAGDPEALVAAVESRGRAVEAIVEVLRAEPGLRSQLAEPLADLDRGAAIAQAALAAVRDASREAVVTLEGRSAAIRGYDTGAAESASLDHPA